MVCASGGNSENFKVEPLSPIDLSDWIQTCRVAYGLALDDKPGLATAYRSAGDQAVVRAAKNYLVKHHAEAVGVEQLAGILKIDGSRLAEVFYASQGMTLMEFQTQERIHHAQRLLLQSSLSVEAIAKGMGYDTAAQFTTVFRKLTGVTPGVYRSSSGADSLTIQGAMRWASN